MKMGIVNGATLLTTISPLIINKNASFDTVNILCFIMRM